MKPLVPALLSLLLCSAVSLRAQVAVPEGSDSLKELKKKYANGGQKPEAPREPKAPAPAPARDGGAPMFKSGLMPALYARSAPGPGGYTLTALADNMKWTEKNLGALIDYIRPWREGEVAPTGKDAEQAYRYLASESAAVPGLIAAADAALARGIPRDPRDPNDSGLRKILLFVSRPVMGYASPTPEQRLLTLAGQQCNVLGHGAALIEFKRLNPPDAKGEADTEGWLENARKGLAETQKKSGG